MNLENIIKPEMILLVVAVIGGCQAVKKMGVKIRNVYTSLVLSIVMGIVGTSPLTWQGAAVTTLVVYAVATMSWEVVVKRFKPDGK